MDFSLSDTEKEILDLVKQVADEQLAPRMNEVDETGIGNRENFEMIGELGILGLLLPDHFGGTDLGYLAYAMCVEEISRGDFNVGLTMSVHTMAVDSIYKFGTDAQKEKYLPKCASGENLMAFALSEPDYGSDAASLKCHAAKQDGGYLLNGTKAWISNADIAELFILFATIDPKLSKRGITTFIIEKDTPGFEVGKHEPKMGGTGTAVCQLNLTDCFIPNENVLGEEGKGLRTALNSLSGGRIGIAANATGVSQRALEEALAYSKVRVQFEVPICEFQGIQWKLAEMDTKIEAGRLLYRKAAFLKEAAGADISLDPIKEASQAKYFATDISLDVCSEAVQIMGGYGYSREYNVERLMRYSKVTQIFEGTNEIQRNLIARELLKS